MDSMFPREAGTRPTAPNAVAISSTKNLRAVLAASAVKSPNKDEGYGSLYVFQYNTKTGDFPENPTYVIRPKNIFKDNVTIEIGGLGTSVKISADGDRIIAGAADSLYIVKYENGTECNYPNVGVILIFDFINNTWEQTGSIIPPLDLIYAGANLGTELSVSPDSTRVVASFYNKPRHRVNDTGIVFISQKLSDRDWSEPFVIKAPPKYAGGTGIKFGAAMILIDDSTLVIGSHIRSKYGNLTGITAEDVSIKIYKRKGDNTWNLESEIQPKINMSKLQDFGNDITVPIGFSELILAVYNEKDITYFQFYDQNVTTKKWSFKEEITVYKENKMKFIYFCDKTIFATFYDAQVENGMRIFELDPNKGSYVMGPKIVANVPGGAKILYGTDLAWRNDCNMLIIGSKEMTSSRFNLSRAYVYKRDDDDGHIKHQELGKPGFSRKTIILICCFVSVILIVGGLTTGLLVVGVISKKGKPPNA